MGNILNIRTISGNYVDIDVVDIIQSSDKKYIVYSLNDDNFNDMYVSILNENSDDNSYSMDSIQDKEEFRNIQEFIWNSNLGEVVSNG